MENFENLGLLIENENDRRIGRWLVKEVGPDRVRGACLAMNGKKWPAAVAKKIRILLPDSVYNPPKAQANAALAADEKAVRDRANAEKLRSWRAQRG